MKPARRCIAVLLTWLALPFATLAQEPPKPPTWGLHGMLLFGGADAVYASHLPMFHAPHDHQIVFALRLADPVLDAQLRRQLAEAPKVWTLVPEKFELARLSPRSTNPLKSFKADIVEGHFERGGATRQSGVTVLVQRIERFQALDPKAAPGRQARYRAVGAGRTWFLVKDIDARPDFDHVLAVHGPRKPATFVLPVDGVKQPPDAALQRRLPRGDKLLGSVYFDTADLQ